MKESNYQRKLMKKLKLIDSSFFFVKEAKAIRGIADIIGCINGRFVALEVKKELAGAMRRTGRTVLQRKTIQDIQKAGGYGAFVYPENEEEILNDLKEISGKEVLKVWED